MTYSASTIADWFVAWADTEEPTDLTNLKLQKVLYYAQGHYLANQGQPLFSEDIQAWSHGPVVPGVYHRFKRFGSAPLQLDETSSFKWDDVDHATTQFLIRIWNTYGALAAWRLRNMTHDERPWLETFKPKVSNLVIPHDALRSFFATRSVG